MNTLLEVENLKVDFITSKGKNSAVRGISFVVNKGEILGLVGESGCGKSATVQAVLRLHDLSIQEVQGQIRFENENLLDKSEGEMRQIRGKKISMIFQDPVASLNPTQKVGKQITENLFAHEKITTKQAKAKCLALLEELGIQDPARRMNQYPHELSGGMCQRILIAMALICDPTLLIADEPTTALDVTVQAQILDILRNLRKKFDMSILLVTHDLGVVANLCDRVLVMHEGLIVESNGVDELFENPQHPYTKSLLSAKEVPCLC